MTTSKQPKWRYRSSVTGKYVSQIYALGNERETYRVPAKRRTKAELAAAKLAEARPEAPSLGSESP